MKRHKMHGILLVMLSAGLLAYGNPVARAANQSGCVSCHTNEAKLTANVAEVKAKKSALQAGTG
ncbi:MAG: hypothetical protein OEL55_03680 [Desulfobulbaceae bacterium]|nr:hypothetical protein [Desulfobulbaceae bacterium]